MTVQKVCIQTLDEEKGGRNLGNTGDFFSSAFGLSTRCDGIGE